jgi:HK97 family phage major capsid protein
MELKEMTIEQLEERKTELVAEIDGCEEMEKLEELRSNIEAIKAEMENRAQIEAEKAEIRSAVANNEVPVVEVQTFPEERAEVKNMEEVRNSREYVEAYANYIKTGNEEEVRSLLTTNATGGTVAIPDMVYDIVKTAWSKEGIIARVKKAYIKGNLKVGFEISATGAVIHTEGGSAVTEETLVLGTVTLVPQSIKKWISISDEAMDLRGEAFLQYIYDELAYQIAKKAADEVVAAIEACGTQSTATSVGVPVVTATAISIDLVAQALGNLSDEANNPVVMMNKATWSAFKAVQYANGYSVDPFEGLDVVFNNTIKSFAAASSGDTFAIVGDLGQGALINLPNGEGIEFKFDDKTDMTKDLVRVLGREYMGIGIVGPNSFVKIQK